MIKANHLKLKSDTDHSMLGGQNRASHGFKAYDLVLYNGGKNAGLVLKVHEDQLTMINEQS